MLLREALGLFTEGQNDGVIIEDENGRPIYCGSIVCMRLKDDDLAREVAGFSVSPAFSIEGAATGATLHIKTRKAIGPAPLEAQTGEAAGIVGELCTDAEVYIRAGGSEKRYDEFVIVEHEPRRDGTVPTRLVPAECLPKWEALNYRPVGRGVVERPLYRVRDNLVATAEGKADRERATLVARRMIEACKKAAAEFGIEEEAAK